jgi:cytosine/uracil/thiamine/allantoin permease
MFVFEGSHLEDTDILTTMSQWCNRDLIPIPEDRRTWTWQGFAGYWIITGMEDLVGEWMPVNSPKVPTVLHGHQAQLSWH